MAQMALDVPLKFLHAAVSHAEAEQALHYDLTKLSSRPAKLKLKILTILLY